MVDLLSVKTEVSVENVFTHLSWEADHHLTLSPFSRLFPYGAECQRVDSHGADIDRDLKHLVITSIVLA